jgi:hypothetical protein
MPRKLKHKGLTRINGGVCLLQNYCPFCFKGKIGVSNGLYVEKNSHLINEVQAFHASKGNGLCPLDLKSPGDFCVNTLLCKMVCLVCGKATIDGTDPEFELFYDLFGCEEDQQCAVTAKYEINDAMEEYGLVWTEMWDMPIHKECSQKTVCKCVVPIGTKVCPTHQRSLAAPVCPVAKPSVKEPQPLEVKQISARIASAPVLVPAAVGAKTVVMPAARGTSGGLKKADWLPPPTITAKATGTALMTELDQKHAKVKAKRDSVVNTGTTAAVPVLTKPSINTLRMEAAASISSFKIDDWAGKHPTNTKLARERVITTKAGTNATGFSLKEHNKNFDWKIHGPYIIDGDQFYRRGDGVLVPRTSDVNTLNEDGTLTPLA